MTDDHNAHPGQGSNLDPDGAAGPPTGERHGPGGHRHPALRTFARSGFIEYDRVLFFSDAVFAIAITLLAIDLKVLKPPTPGKTLHGHHLHEVIPATQLGIDKYGLISFGISFAVIGVFWLSHHAIFRYIVALDRTLISINLLFLGTIALLPYPTRLLNMTRFPGAAGVVFYAICTAAAGLAECGIWLYATRPGGGLAAPSAAAIRLRYALRIASVPMVFLASIPVALVAPQDAPYLWLLIFVLRVVINRAVPEPDEPEPIVEQIRG